MSLLQRLTPINLLEEKAKFLVDPTYNPQFVFTDPVDREVLRTYGLPQPKYVDLAREILDRAYFGRNEQDLFMMEGPVVDQAEVEQKVLSFLKIHHLEKRLDVVWSGSFVSRTSVTSDTIKIRLPVDFRKEGLLGMLYHEVGTHVLRRINYEQQSWFKKKKQYGFSEYLLTEEGLAVLHALIPHTFKLNYIGAIRYIAVAIAQEKSFAQVWNYLGKYVQDGERRWNIALRAKRGLADTSQPGGFTKDLVYMQGAVETWQWLSTHDFDPTLLYFGKIAAEDADKAEAMSQGFEPMLPTFFSLYTEKYKQDINTIGVENLFNQL